MTGVSNTIRKELIGFVEAMDRCWLERRFDELSAYLASDVLFAAPNGTDVRGAQAAIDSHREFVSRSTILSFETSGWEVTSHGDAALVHYTWSMRWTSNGATQDAQGREAVLVSKRPEGWRVVSRTQTPLDA